MTDAPKTLDEALDALKGFMKPEDLEEIMKMDEGMFMAQTHHGLGRWMRNNWGLWDGSTELFYFFQDMGLTHADDMSGIILTSYYRTLHGKELNLDAEIKKYQDHWKKYAG